MSADAPNLPQAASTPAPLPAVSLADIDRSCRLPVMYLFVASAIWLLIGLFLALLASVKLHAPGMMADAAWSTFGRVRPASTTAFVYGFAIQAGLGIALWMIARLGRTLLEGSVTLFVAAKVWNVGVLLGVGGILAGHSTGFEWLEMPRYAAAALFAGLALIAVWGLITVHFRKERALEPAQWFIIAALLWIPWVFTAAEVLLVFRPVRGVMQAVVAGWFAANLFQVGLASLGLAVLFHFIPLLTGRPLSSRPMALIGFWGVLFLGGLGGLHAGMPVPKWLPSLGVVAAVLFIVPLIAIVLTLNDTKAGAAVRDDAALPWRFIKFAFYAFIAANVLRIAAGFRTISSVTQFTLFDPGLANLFLFGFVAVAFAGAVYYIVPRICDGAWAPGLSRLHFIGTTTGAVLVSVPLLLGGVFQGLATRNVDKAFVDVARQAVPFIGMGTLGWMVLLLSQAAFVLNLGKLIATCCRTCCACVIAPKTAEVRA